ncbi:MULTISPECIES: SMP-30/gluconolactonase/LRE family protein [Mesorhizobium]|uniref:SMP-30/gluconolactonase/LRE family protein n=1 Tax=Mesorhizobium denitrificans TaxID=2294114 RepID=A0A371XI64_9HYPH|nr:MULTISPECIES: SMP-30/gluconolactonase/LRE family protein [Mesorhizobium]RFC68920.1 SMP-30/gluconolactonase/LRE family protein [Mesorhizobium denitrificans]
MADETLTFTRCIDFETRIGEGPVWDEQRGVLWFVDILAPALFSYDPAQGRVQRFDMPDLVTSVGVTIDGRLILSLRTSVQFFDPLNGSLELFVSPDMGDPLNRLNDGKVGPDGCFWVGSMHDKRPAKPTGALYRITPAGKCSVILQGIHVSNGLAWAPDGRTMYHADSRGPFIKKYDFDPTTGAMSNARIIAEPDESTGLPDGAAVDCDGNYWSAGVTSGRLNVFSPNGDLLRKIAVPMAAPTMPCFGGADLRTLFLTGLTKEVDGKILSRGTLVSCLSPVKGIGVSKFGRRDSRI